MIELEDEFSATGVPETVMTEHRKVIRLMGIVGIVPIAHVDDRNFVFIKRFCEIHQLRQGTDGRIIAHESDRLGMPYVQVVGNRVVGADRVDEVTLEALSYEYCFRQDQSAQS